MSANRYKEHCIAVELPSVNRALESSRHKQSSRDASGEPWSLFRLHPAEIHVAFIGSELVKVAEPFRLAVVSVRLGCFRERCHFWETLRPAAKLFPKRTHAIGNGASLRNPGKQDCKQRERKWNLLLLRIVSGSNADRCPNFPDVKTSFRQFPNVPQAEKEYAVPLRDSKLDFFLNLHKNFISFAKKGILANNGCTMGSFTKCMEGRCNSSFIINWTERDNTAYLSTEYQPTNPPPPLIIELLFSPCCNCYKQFARRNRISGKLIVDLTTSSTTSAICLSWFSRENVNAPHLFPVSMDLENAWRVADLPVTCRVFQSFATLIVRNSCQMCFGSFDRISCTILGKVNRARTIWCEPPFSWNNAWNMYVGNK